MEKTIDPIWEKIHSSQAWGMYPAEHVIRFVARNYYNKDRKNIRILDFGCGQGAHSWYLAREGFDTYAFDGAESAIIKCKKRFKEEGLTAHFEVADAGELPYEENFFDAVIDSACIYANRLHDIKMMYKETFLVLKPGGKLLTVCFGEELSGYTTGKEIEPGTYIDIKEGALKDRGISHIYKPGEIESVLRATGFNNICCDWNKYEDNGNRVHLYICSAQK